MLVVKNKKKRTFSLIAIFAILVSIGILVSSVGFSVYGYNLTDESVFSEKEHEKIIIEEFYIDEDVKSDTRLSSKWDITNNSFDLVDGSLTIQLTINELSAPEILSQSKGLAELLIVSNLDKPISTIELEINSGEKNYFFDSKTPDRIAKVNK